jgi:quercetin 2,3-dioxygenase
MSGPVRQEDLAEEQPTTATIELREGRRTSVGGMGIVRVLPTKGRRTVGAWCFVDCMLPSDADEPDPMEVGPHPHIGLSTATWLFTGQAVHGDSLGTEQVLRPGQLNLMTAGRGIAHAELELGRGIQGVQLWIAQPESTRFGPNAFAHHADLPTADLDTGQASVFMGSLLGETSPARQDSPLVGAELSLRAGQIALPVAADFEHAVVPIDAPVLVGGEVVDPGWLGFVPAGASELVVEAGEAGARVMLLGGTPFETVSMWWNFVARTQDELTEAYEAWQAHDTERFGRVPSDLPRIDAPRPPWLGPS